MVGIGLLSGTRAIIAGSGEHNQLESSAKRIDNPSASLNHHLPVLARFIPVLFEVDMLGLMLALILGPSSLIVPFRIANSLSCCFL